MATKETIIIELDFDASDFTQSAAKLNKEISDLNKNQRDLKKQGQEGSVQYQKNTEALKENKQELNEINKTINNVTKANKAQAGSNEQLKAQLSVLTLKYNKLGKEERQSGARGKELNDQINQTTESLKENEEGVGDNRRSVGDYGKALSDTPFGSFIGGIQSMGKAFLANPIGLIITAIVLAFKALQAAFQRNEENSKKLNKITGALAGVFNGLLAVIEPLANFIADVLIFAFESLTKAADDAIGLISDGLSALGFDDAAASVDNFTNSLKENAEASVALADAEDELVKAKRTQRLIELESLKAAEEQRQIRDDESKSIDERIAANKELGNVLEEQLGKEIAIAKESLRIVEERIKLEGASSDNLDARADALIEVADIQERITGQQSEQLVNVNSLRRDEAAARKEAADARKAAAQKAIGQSKLEIELFIQSQGIKAKSLEEEIAIAQKVSDDKLAILHRELDSKLITQTQFELQSLQIQQDFLLKQAEATITVAERELEEVLKINESKLDSNQFLNDELFNQEQERLARTLEAESEFQALRLEQGLINQQEFNDAINAINEENNAEVQKLEEDKAAADAEKKMVDLENQREIDLLNKENEFELRQQDLDRAREQEIAAAEQTGADTALIRTKFDKLEEELDKQKRAAQVNTAKDTFAAIGVLVKGNAEAEKAAAVASATINAYQGITAVLAAKSTIPEPFGSIAKGIQATAIGVSAFRNVQKILSTQVPKAAKGGVFGGKPHSQGGTKGVFDDGTQLEVEKDEIFVVLNKNSSSMIDRLSGINEAGGGVSFGRGGAKSFLQDGGVGLNGISTSVESEADQASNLLDAISTLPAPVVVVQDINEVQQSVNIVETRAIV